MTVPSEHFSGTGSVAELRKGFVKSGIVMFVAVDSSGSIVYAEGSEGVVGFTPSQLVSTQALDYLHPDDRVRGAVLFAWRDESGRPIRGVTAFRVLTASGDHIDVEIRAGSTSDGVRDYVGLYLQRPDESTVVERVLTYALSKGTLAESLATVINAFNASQHGTHVAICWPERGAFDFVSTGLPARLAGADPDTPPWAACRQSGQREQGGLDDLDEETRALAVDAGVAEYWVEAVPFSPVDPPATITVWTTGGVRTPDLHRRGMRSARTYSELILRWSARNHMLEDLANRDTLTGLFNRRVFFERLAGAGPGAILYCDLDHFKPINDELGHSAGDSVLKVAARRISGCVRGNDVVARLGGDEFAVLCEGAGLEEASEIAYRILSAVSEPIALEGQQVSVGVTIGLALGVSALSGDTVERADRALREGKAAGRAMVRVAGGSL
ncbi:MAG TPA: sensor domain-containing diguanylate cyclase [Acidimicrobiales bacterium]|nr:sensor domain-containing diguanylate cyclase [Acidimicrobiales bacterium]